MAKITKQELKKWFHSKTLWINGLVLLSGLALAFADHLAAGGALTAVSIANLLLRVISKAELVW